MFVHEVDGSPLPTGGAGGCCVGGVAEGRGADGCSRGGGRNPKQFGFSPSAKNIYHFIHIVIVIVSVIPSSFISKRKA